MAKKKAAKKSTKRTVRKVAGRKGVAKRKAAKRAPSKAAASWSRTGVITHTELASADPAATKQWLQRVLGWKFGPSMPTPGGPYHMWQFANRTGGGIRANNPPETPGSIPYVEVANIKAAYAKALKAGAHEMLPPMAIPGNMGWIAVVAAPGGPAIGFWAMK